MDVTTVADDLIVCHEGTAVTRLDSLTPSTTYSVHGHDITTRPRPAGELLCRFTTVNDVHFGEVEAGRIGGHAEGPIQRREPGEEPYPIVMNRGAAAEMAAVEPAVVLVKGDLTADGTDEEFAAFEACYRATFGERLHTIRGNHDSYRGQDRYAGDHWIPLAGLAVALVDTTVAFREGGDLTAEQLDWLETHLAESETPVIVMGHHHQWLGHHSSTGRHEESFGLHPDASEALDAMGARHANLIAYTSGHSHRHRVRHMVCGIPSIEVGCVKDFPGTWAEYRVYETAVDQVVHRVSTPDALAWSERCRHLYSDFGLDYETFALGTLEDRCCTIPLR